MATKAEMVRILKRVKKWCNPEIARKGDMLIRDTCILHRYLQITKEGENFPNDYGCLGGNICYELQNTLRVKHSSICTMVHSNVYNLVKNGREIRI